MNESYELMMKRRTIRAFKNDAIADELMEQIIRAGKYAPSAMGMQNRHFTIVRSPALLGDIVAAATRNGAKFVPGHTPFYNAPDVVVVSAPRDFKYNREDAACAVQNILLAAASLGIGSCYICSVLPGLCDEAVMKELKLPGNYIPCGCVSLGWPAAEAPEPKPRRTDDVTLIP